MNVTNSIASTPHAWLSTSGVPLQTSRYRRKLRILATNDCTATCWFCHNEGMPKQHEARMHVERLVPLLRQFGELTQHRAVISGGEPALSPELPTLLEALGTAAFDVTLICSRAGIERLEPVLDHVSGLHFSTRL